MPKVEWTKLSPYTKGHLLDRLKTREITAEDLHALMEWMGHSPAVLLGKWFKDFGTFKLCGEGEIPSTFLSADQAAYGSEVD